MTFHPHDMPPRLNKRQLRELEELKALDDTLAPDVQDDAVSVEEDEVPIAKAAAGGFAAVREHALGSLWRY